MYHMYCNEEPDPKKAIMEKVFLKSCVPVMHELMRKTIPTGCVGCQKGWESQMEHDCLGYGYAGSLWMNFTTLTVNHYEKAAPLMVQKLPKVNKNTVLPSILCT